MNRSERSAEDFPSPEDDHASLSDDRPTESGGILSEPALTSPAGADRNVSSRETGTEPADSSLDDQLGELAADFLARHRHGEHPSIGEYADRNPHLADEIRDLFPTIAQMEGLRIQVDEEEQQGEEPGS